MSQPYTQIYDGQWNAVLRKNNFTMCCDCGLVHVADYRLAGGRQIQERVTRNKRATAAARRRLSRTKHHFLIPREK